MANTYLQRTPSSATNRKTFTWSGWVKRSSLGQNYFFSQGSANSDNFAILFNGSDQFYFWDYHGSWDFEFKTNAKYRDTNGWYHFVVAIDTTQATQSNRVKAYINGEQITSWATANYPNQNDDTRVNNTTEVRLGRYVASETSYFNGLISHVHLCEGTQYQATAFGSTDATTGEWQINTSPSVSYGTNGFFILKDGNSVTDQSPNTNNFTVGGGTLTKTEDNPSNVFATWNPLDNFYANATLSNGNNYVTTNGTAETFNTSTLGMSSGKYYFEIKDISSSNERYAGVSYLPSTGTYNWCGNSASGWGYQNNGIVYNNNSSVGGSWATWTSGDIIGVAINMDDLQGGLNKLYFSKNGVWQNGADPSNHSSVTGVVGITSGETYFFATGDKTGSSCQLASNFGNGIFNQSAVSSEGTNASGNGIFEYDVPTGFTALSTKGLNL